MCSAVLISCASVGGPASRPQAALSVPIEPRAPVTEPESYRLRTGGDQGVREMLAGFELELGDERAKTAAEAEQRKHAEEAAQFWQGRAEQQQRDELWRLIGTGVGSALVGALIAGIAVGVAAR